MGAIRNYLRLIRFERALSATFGVLLTGIVVDDLVKFQSEYVIACLVVFFSSVANFGLNDYCDVETDIRNRRMDRPIAQGQFDPKIAILTVIISIGLALILSLFLNPVPRLLIYLGLPLSLLYNLGLKRYLLLKNAFIGLANVGVALIGSLVSDTILEPLALYIAAIGFFFSLSYETMLDIADMEGDRAQGVNTLPNRFGVKNATIFSLFFGFGAIIIDPLPFFIEIDSRLSGDYIFLSLIMLPMINRLFISKSLLKDQSPENIFRLKKRVFRNLQLGGLCYLIGFLL
jgi:4-hydroxybenzoate polyprenyltransferase